MILVVGHGPSANVDPEWIDAQDFVVRLFTGNSKKLGCKHEGLRYAVPVPSQSGATSSGTKGSGAGGLRLFPTHTLRESYPRVHRLALLLTWSSPMKKLVL
jgi:hypothetical protein